MMPEFSPELIDQLVDAIDLRQSERTALKRLELAYREARKSVSALQAEAVIASIERGFEANAKAKRRGQYLKALAQADRDFSPQEVNEIYQSCSASPSQEKPE